MFTVVWLMSLHFPHLLLDAAPVCAQGASPETCANNLIGAAAPVAHALVTFVMWLIAIVAGLAILFKTPGAIIQIAAGNSRVLSVYLICIGLILGLVILSFNTWPMLAWGATLVQHVEPDWNNPIPFQSTPTP